MMRQIAKKLGLAILLVISAAFGMAVAAETIVSDVSETEGESTTALIISNASFVAPSPERENLNGEWVEITNTGDEDVAMAGWILVDGQDHEYAFPEDFVLSPGASVRVHTGNGNDSESELYWGLKVPVWNNDGDIATLVDESGNAVDRYP